MKKLVLLLFLFCASITIVKAQNRDLDSLKAEYNFEVIDGGVKFEVSIDSLLDLPMQKMFPLVYDACMSMFSEKVVSSNKETGVILINGYELVSIEFPRILECFYRMRVKVTDYGFVVTAKYYDYYQSSKGKANIVGFILKNYPFEDLNESNEHVRVPDECFINVCKGFYSKVKTIKERTTGDDF